MSNRSRCARRNRNHAYTLIELLIVVAMLGIAASMVVPQLSGRESLTVQAAVRQVISDLNFAASDALAHQEYRRVVFFDDGTGYAIVRVTDATFNNAFDPGTADFIYDPMASAAENGQYIVDFDEDSRFEGVTISAAALDGTNRFVTYDALGGTVTSGGVPGLGGTIEITLSGFVYEITIEPFTGKMNVAKTST
jgi:prepilin-type N-terminal cleavage/methylation domain-containing protein